MSNSIQKILVIKKINNDIKANYKIKQMATVVESHKDHNPLVDLIDL